MSFADIHCCFAAQSCTIYKKGLMNDADQRNSTATLPSAVIDLDRTRSGPNAGNGLRLLSRSDERVANTQESAGLLRVISNSDDH